MRAERRRARVMFPGKFPRRRVRSDKNDREIEVIAPDLHAGDLAVILGNYELKDGMAVSVEKSQ